MSGASGIMMKRLLRLLTQVLLALFFAVASNAHAESAASQPFGTQDSIAYWSAIQSLQKGLNPYDPSSLQPFTASSGREVPQRFLNPPMVIPVLSIPFLSEKFEVAARVWLVVIISAILIGLYQLGARREVFAISLIFPPVIYAVWVGQLTPLIFLFAYWSYSLLLSRSPLVAGCSAGLLLIKPHLFLGFLTFLILGLNRQDKIRFLVGIGLCAGVLTLIAEWSYPGIHSLWLLRDQFAESLKTSSLSTYARELISPQGNATWPIWAMCVLSVGSGMLLSRLFSMNRNTSALALALSAALAPYWWIYDMILVLPLYVILLQHVRGKCRAAVYQLAFLALIPSLFVALTGMVTTNLQHLAWFPWLILGLAVWISKADSSAQPLFARHS